MGKSRPADGRSGATEEWRVFALTTKSHVPAIVKELRKLGLETDAQLVDPSSEFHMYLDQWAVQRLRVLLSGVSGLVPEGDADGPSVLVSPEEARKSMSGLLEDLDDYLGTGTRRLDA